MPALRITVITPSYNQGEFLAETMQSVLDQGYVGLEYLVVDGGSTDKSVELIRREADRLAWWVSEKDGGQADAVNKGLQRATGDIVGWLNSDDTYCPGALAAVAEFFRQHPECDAVVGDLEIIDAQGRQLDVKKAVPFSLRQNLYSGCAVPQPATFFTRRALERAGQLDVTLRYQLDYEFFLRMQAKGVRFGILRRPLARFRLHGQSKTVAEYRHDFWRDFAQIQSAYTARGETVRRWLKLITRIELFMQRALLRGVLVPFRYSRVRHRTENAA